MADVATAPKADSAAKGKKVAKSLPPRVYGPEGGTFVSCDCGCGDKPVSAAMYYTGTLKCSKGGPTEAFKATFKVIEVEAPAAKAKPGKRKSEGSASKATTPVKDKEEKGDDEEEKEKSPAKKKQKADKEDKKESKKKEGKAKKDDDAPKRAPSAYILYSNDERPKIKEANPELKMTDISKKIGEQWNALAEEDKKPYHDKAAELKAEYQEKHGLSASEEKAKAKKDKPSKPVSGYMLFMMANRDKVKEEMDGIANKDIMKVLGSRWKELSEEDKKVWNDKSAAAKEEFAKNGGKAPAEEEKEAEEKEEEEKEEESKEEEKEEVAASQSPAKEEESKEEEKEEKEGEDEKMADAKEGGDAEEESEEPSTTQQEE